MQEFDKEQRFRAEVWTQCQDLSNLLFCLPFFFNKNILDKLVVATKQL